MLRYNLVRKSSHTHSMTVRWKTFPAQEGQESCVLTGKQKRYHSSNLFRSSDLGVMSPARFLCAMLLYFELHENHTRTDSAYPFFVYQAVKSVGDINK
ncbi:hypothetical protein BDN67DRAFT_350930 [Paxillus ammoniavirescens]|nr:hypothetical protein BDN67DRAFT_350930 [Paxillus ammoniavirescens]